MKEYLSKYNPIINSLLDTDFYKLLMLQLIWKFYPNINVTFSLINRQPKLYLSDKIDESELRDQLDHARSLRITEKEKIWLTDNIFYGKKQIFEPKFLSWLSNFQLPEYDLSHKKGHYILEFHGLWKDVTLWEIPSLIIINTLYARATIRSMNPFSIDRMYAQAKDKLLSKIIKLKNCPGLKIADFGTRRRHSLIWQKWCIESLQEGMKDSFLGTSNTMLAMNYKINAIGTSAHELPMVASAIAPTDIETQNAPYQMMQQWNKLYDDNLLIALPDSFGTDFFLEHAPSWIAKWKGFRHDSASPIEGGEKIISWWKKMNCNPQNKLLVFSDNLDVNSIINIYKHFENRVQMIFGWGTNLTNDFDCMPDKNLQIEKLQIVCKVTMANNKNVVKLSDDPDKTTGDNAEIKRYTELFK
ncbi:nicotinate phosphoribosyltransferase [Candidatus Liberibacter africanus]|uniref:Nicotinate phosphoribosyltransferase n=1 Tax=Candidatus Liberibacter africanus PTSAPSY TaxID=1277257 RepID=A0A0G3I2T9_LIBAF|nr:nicotinate phosphoribosyltransferase [Candidatus Liberibacter africanus]AKK20201.1 nicotinate phosphoribosyltransferase [Candidatus Liberibacter africanus PTSAPSY]QTP63983.1 nicotinate phosphoribosyltransferase [Candidatus Liberibacter africanus]